MPFERIVWDIETDGLLDECTKIHSLVIRCIESGSVMSCVGTEPEVMGHYKPIHEGLTVLSKASERIGHNTLKFDLKVIEKLYPGTIKSGLDTDTMILSQLMYPDIKERDAEKIASGQWSKEFLTHNGKSLFGRHSLAAWGKRIGTFKGEYTGGFDTWSPEMQEYAEQDVETTYQLWRYLKPHEYSQEAIRLEHEIVKITHQMELDGIPFDISKAAELQSLLVSRKEVVRRQLEGLFEPWEVVDREYIAKRPNKSKGVAKGDTVTVKKTVYFNPGSRDHIAKCLTDKYGWKPKVFTPTGKPMINDEVLEELEYPEAKQLSEYFTVCKRLAQLAEGDEGWMQRYDSKKGVIHAAYSPMGTVTSRCSHHSPNIGQVPAVDKPYGKDCRSLFGSVPGMVLVGTDMSGLELRCLAHYMAHFDGGKYADVVTTGDVHTVNQQAAGLATRQQAKTMAYAVIYGAGVAKVGAIVGGGPNKGREVLDRFYRNTPALRDLMNSAKRASNRRYLIGLDGRKVPVRAEHAALNTLLQSAGAILCKEWVVRLHAKLPPGSRFACWVHDELQIICKPEDAEMIGKLSNTVAQEVAEHFKLKCPLATEYKVGDSWASTH